MTDIRLQATLPQTNKPVANTSSNRSATKSSFDAAMLAAGLHVSTHAGQRLATREIQLGEPEAKRLATAVNQAEKKGGRDSLILMDDLAFIVDVQKRMVVTAVDQQSRKEGVFTNIDTVVLAQ